MFFINEELPIEKVERVVRRVLINSLKSGKNDTTLYKNIMGIHSKPFFGVADNQTIIPSTSELDEDKQIVADANIFYSTSEEDPRVLVYLERSSVERLGERQLYELIEAIMDNNLYQNREYSAKVLNEDMDGLDELHWVGKDMTPDDFKDKADAENEDDKEGSGSCSLSAEDMKKAAEKEIESKRSKSKKDIVEITEDFEPKTTEETIASFTNLKVPESNAKNFVSDWDTKMTEEDMVQIAVVQDIFEQSMRFDGTGKAKTSVPSKRLNMKAIVTESSDNEFIGKRIGAGKKVRLMVTIDRSGSMSGYPTKMSNILISALNNIVLENPELEVEVMLSHTGAVMKFELPVGGKFSGELWNLKRIGDAEYIWQNMKKHINSIMKADINLIFTDGSLVDDPVDKTYLHSRDVFTTGLYVSNKMDIENIKQHYNRNKQYFDHVIVRKSVEELAEEIAEKIFIERSGR